ncbi:filamentous hemagglutinin N-terminal domain-containing protein [Serratia plymuthica]|uniref:two-partner secretion domain-containing protein n=1 Tax=Serratia TaxID=613 RepID=UPI0007EAF7A7|nr:GLUG motif-containing protein [Serratia plymuthica]ANJ93660.1 hypothetical protein ADP72_12050 [Serratia plymuthica]UJE01634.1 filamentous hemagglutinin N-terminal domain-containing protein [Serratia plymuthica]
MNKIYALVWNPAQDCWNVVNENRSRRGKRSSKRRLAVVLSLLGLVALEPAYALPTGQNIVAGQGNIATNGQQMTVNQQSGKLITQWDGFNVGSNESVTFKQPSSDSVALNRVMGVNGSNIQGNIDANGKVFLVNPNGVVFGKNAQVNVGGLVASTHDISNADFLAGKNRFVGKSVAEVRNDGTLTAAQTGSVALLGAHVSNQGVIQAQMGSIALGAGNDITLNFDGNKLLNLQVDGAALETLVQNGGLLKANGGQVLMTAKTASSMLQNVVNNQGTIEATTLNNQTGRIMLDGGAAGTVNVAGRLDASAAAGNGGMIETRGANVVVQPAVQVTTRAANGKTGSWKVATTQVNVADNGTLNGATLGTSLANNNVALTSTEGNVSVSAPVNWSNGNKLSLTSERAGIQINAPLDATGAGAALELNHKTGYALNNDAAITLSGSGAAFSANGENYQVVQSLQQLVDIDSRLGGRYVLGTNITHDGKVQAIGSSAAFSGVFDGLGHTVKGLTVESKGPHSGLFSASTGKISNLTLDSLTVAGKGTGSSVGALVGRNEGEIINVKAVNVSVSKGSELGGLAGRNEGTISNSSASGKVTGNGETTSIGGLVGVNFGDKAIIRNSQANVAVSGSMQSRKFEGGAGGLVGANIDGIIDNSSSHGNVTAKGSDLSVGGLAGFSTEPGYIANSVATGNVSAGKGSYVGGLIGLNTSVIKNSAASGQVNGAGTDAIGGLVGWNLHGIVTGAKASGNVSDLASANVGGLIGNNYSGDVQQSEARNIVTGGANANIGGLVGHNHGELSNVAYYGNVYAGNNSLVGGLIGLHTAGTIAAAQANGNVTGYNSSSAGGLVGENNGMTLRNVKASGSVTGGQNVGGLVGNNIGGYIDNARAQGTVSAGRNSRIGGLVGNNDRGTLNNTQALVSVTGGDKSYSGGLVGYNNGTLSLASATGDVIGGAESYVGGVVGIHVMGTSNRISQTKAAGKVTGGRDSSVGGLAGQNEALIENSTASGQLSGGNGAILGGLAGKNGGKINSSMFNGNIKLLTPATGQRAGSLAGVNFGYLTGNKVSGESEKLPLSGINMRPGSIK